MSVSAQNSVCLLLFFWSIICLFNKIRRGLWYIIPLLWYSFKLINSIHSIYIKLIHNLDIAHLNSLYLSRIFISNTLLFINSFLFLSIMFIFLPLTFNFLFSCNTLLFGSRCIISFILLSLLFSGSIVSFSFNIVFNLFGNHNRTK